MDWIHSDNKRWKHLFNFQDKKNQNVYKTHSEMIQGAKLIAVLEWKVMDLLRF